jgi:Nucleotidyltransferase domain
VELALSHPADDQPALLPAGFLATLAAELDGPEIIGIALGGSFARGVATAYSDVDLAPFYRVGASLPPKRLFWRDGWLVSVSPKTVDSWRERMTRPEWAIQLVPSATQLVILLDKEGALAALVAEARAFRWEPLLSAADAFASDLLMLYAEQALKLLGALVQDDEAVIPYPLGELLHALAWAVATQRGVLIESGSAYYRQVQTSVGTESAWSHAHRRALGMHGESLRERAGAALQLYVETAQLIADALQLEHREVVSATTERIARVGYASFPDHTNAEEFGPHA